MAPTDDRSVPAPTTDPALRLVLLRDMLRVRLIEERIVALYADQEMRCPTHFSIGQEAAAVGVAAHLTAGDNAISAHRSHAHYLTKGGDLRAMMAELYGKETGCARGKGGSMHLIDLSVKFLGCVPIVGSTIPIGVGAAFGDHLKGTPNITVIYFGDGAVETGVFHESVNFAVVHKLPILFVCENNLYSVLTPLAPRQPEGRNIADFARAYGLNSMQLDGQDVDLVHAAAGRAVQAIRTGQGPWLLELMTYRWLEHCGPEDDTKKGFRDPAELAAWYPRDPLLIARQRLEAEGHYDAETDAAWRAEFAQIIDDAVAFAKASPFPARAALTQGVFA